MLEELVERSDDGGEAFVLSRVGAGGDDSVVPFDGVGERGAAELRASDVGDASAEGLSGDLSVEDVGLGVEALGLGSKRRTSKVPVVPCCRSSKRKSAFGSRLRRGYGGASR